MGDPKPLGSTFAAHADPDPESRKVDNSPPIPKVRDLGYGGGRLNPCGGAVIYGQDGKRGRKYCSMQAVAGQALCESCRATEREYRERELQRLQREGNK